MKRIALLVVSVAILLSLASVSFAEEISLDKAWKLLVAFNWTRTESYGTYDKSYSSGFGDEGLSSIKLPKDGMYLTEDGTGDIYIFGETSDQNHNTAAGKVTFSRDQKTMIIMVENKYASEWHVYERR